MTRSSPPEKKTPLDMALRSIAVVEWVGPADHPTSSRLIPIAVYTNDEFLDGGAYLSQPVPLAVQKGTEYILQTSGIPQGTYDVDEARKLNGVWIGFGKWASLPTAPAGFAGDEAKQSITARPTLHLRPPDPDRPKMAYDQPPVAKSDALEAQSLRSPARQQIVAISDSSNVNSRPLKFEWKSVAAEQKMRAQVEALAETHLENSIQKSAGPGHSGNVIGKPTVIQTDFRCFSLHAEPKISEEIPTCIFSGEGRETLENVRYITVIARPDIYGIPRALSYAIAQDDKLETHPRPRLIDAVNADDTQDADLLIELDGATSRRLALYRLNADQVQLVYITGRLPF